MRLARYFEEKVRSDDRFEVAAERHLGMVVFRVKVSNITTYFLLICLRIPQETDHVCTSDS